MTMMFSLVLLTIVAAADSVSSWDVCQAGESTAQEVADLKDQLEKGLKARRPEEFQFVGTVVEMVDDGSLPRELVLRAFHWAREKAAKYQRHPFPYFEEALRRLAADQGIQIP